MVKHRRVIGLVGEDPNDTKSIEALLLKRWPDRYVFKRLARNLRGSQLDADKTTRIIKADCENELPFLVIFIRDVDDKIPRPVRLRQLQEWYKTNSSGIKARSILLINIEELEALIFAGAEAFEQLYGIDLPRNRDVTKISNPKELLKSKTGNSKKQFSESHCPDLFSAMNLELLQKNCAYFKQFMTDLELLLD